MKILEVDDFVGATPDPDKLIGLIDFLAGRAENTNSRKQISQDALISIAQSLDIPINKRNIVDIVGQPPLSNLLEPLEPNSNDPVVFKGAEEPPDDAKMTVPKAQKIVSQMAKSALNRDR